MHFGKQGKNTYIVNEGTKVWLEMMVPSDCGGKATSRGSSIQGKQGTGQNEKFKFFNIKLSKKLYLSFVRAHFEFSMELNAEK